ncbi:uncharacterized protein LOC103281274 isoform X2 [Anolis carolinensis]|uniref:uncharacterized protein LOC103281274 isoform X2 n=1 Tax=Anolis carolinensis TaxID=28377 RepID=UPI002F2B69C6
MWALSSGCGTSWLSLFLADPKTVNISLTPYPKTPTVRASVTIYPENTTRDVTSCLWLRSKNDEDLWIILNMFKPIEKVLRGAAYNGRQFFRNNCGLLITRLEMEDMAVYKFIRNTTSETETGSIFLWIQQEVVTTTPGPKVPQRRVITVGTMAGIIVGCLIGSILVVGVITYHTMKQSERTSWGSGEDRSPHSTSNLGSAEGRSPHSASKPGSQQRLSIHNLGPVPAPQ